MNITIRDTTESDLPNVFRIRTDALVAPHQYQLTARDTIDVWRGYLFGDTGDRKPVFKCTTILNDHEVIGHISQHLVRIGGEDFLGDVEHSLERWPLGSRPYVIAAKGAHAVPRPIPFIPSLPSDAGGPVPAVAPGPR